MTPNNNFCYIGLLTLTPLPPSNHRAVPETPRPVYHFVQPTRSLELQHVRSLKRGRTTFLDTRLWKEILSHQDSDTLRSYRVYISPTM